MEAEILKFVIIARDNTFGQGREEHRRQRLVGNNLRNCFVRCPRCSEIWLVLEADKIKEYLCAECRHLFFIESSNLVG